MIRDKGLRRIPSSRIPETSWRCGVAGHAFRVIASHRLFVTLAKLDHIIWKLNTDLSVAEGEAQFQFVDHHNCRLGKWYDDGPGRKNFSKVPAYPALEAPHALVHTGTRAVLAELGARAETLSAAQIEAIARGLEQMERGSEGVFRVLSELTAR